MMYQRLIFYISMLFQHVYVSAEIQKAVLLLLIAHTDMHKNTPQKQSATTLETQCVADCFWSG